MTANGTATSDQHTITRRKIQRGPLDPRFIPICDVCGPITDATDLDDAKRAGRQHVEQVAADALAAEVGSA